MIRGRAQRRARGVAGLAAVIGLAVAAAPASAQDRQEELDSLREEIEDSRERVTSHEADERALLEQLEDVDRRLTDVIRERDAARRDVGAAQERVDALAPELDRARQDLAQTQRALSARAVALYRGGEIGPVRVLFSSDSLPELLTRASVLRVLVRHDATLVARHADERDRLEAVEAREREALEVRRVADERLAGHARALQAERAEKGTILTRVRQDRTTERQLLLELEQAAQALEETIRTLGSRASSGGVGEGFRERKGELAPPVNAGVVERFGRVVDPEFQTSTFRSGVDFGAEAGDRVRTIAAGVVRFAGWFRGYGRIVIVDHGDGFHTISGHLDEIHVTVGTPVEEGEVVGTVGETGSLYGPSLCFELRQNGEPVDPVPWLLDPRA